MTQPTFLVEARLSGVTVAVPPEQSIAEALICAGIDVPLSCESGICGTCLTNVIEGQPDHRDSYLNDDERAANKEMTLCCSRSFSEKLVLEI